MPEFDWSKYEKSAENKPEEKFDWAKYENKSEESEEPTVTAEEWAAMKKEHPMEARFSEWLESHPGLRDIIQKGGNIAAGSGIPDFRKGMIHGASEGVRGLANLIPGVNLKELDLHEVPIKEVNPLTQSIAGILGNVTGASLPGVGAYKAVRAGQAAIPLIAKLPALLQEISAGGLAGAATNPDSRLIGGMQGAVAGTLPAVIRTGKLAFENTSPKLLIKELQAKHDIIKQENSNIFKNVENQAIKRGINKVNIDESLITKAEDLLPKSEANKSLIEKARTGDFKSVRKLQSDLRAKGEKRLSSPFAADQDQGELMLENRQAINKSIAKHFEESGNKDLATELKKAMSDYKDLKKTYYQDKRLARIFGKERKIPKNPISLLEEDSTAINRLKEKHPEINERLSKSQQKEKTFGFLHKTTPYAKGATGGALGVGLYELLKHLF